MMKITRLSPDERLALIAQLWTAWTSTRRDWHRRSTPSWSTALKRTEA